MMSSKVQCLILLSLTTLIQSVESACPVYLSLSPIGNNAEESAIEVNWGPACTHPPQWIGVYREDPSLSDKQPEVFIPTDFEPTGYVKTELTFGKTQLPGGWNNKLDEQPLLMNRSACLPFFVASFAGMDLITLDCLKIEPSWMNENPFIIEVPLKDLFIPGSHCAGCYAGHKKGPRSVLLNKFGYQQNFDVWTQLVFGIRYLDISVGSNADGFVVLSESIAVQPIKNVLSDVRRFVKLSKEVVIVDLDNFQVGFHNQPHKHEAFAKLLEMELGDICFRKDMYTSDKDFSQLSMDDMRKFNRNCLLLYGNTEVAKGNNLLWPPWRKFSTANIEESSIQDYMRQIFSGKGEIAPIGTAGWAFFGVQGFESVYKADLQQIATSRERADKINKNLAVWVGGPWSRHANVVATDFIMSSNLIDIAIYANKMKYFSNPNNMLLNFELQKK